MNQLVYADCFSHFFFCAAVPHWGFLPKSPYDNDSPPPPLFLCSQMDYAFWTQI